MSISSIKITALNNIGNSIAYTTLVPVVNMTGTPTTEKANLQIVGNLILNGSGGAYFPAAAQAITAQTVSNAAQPAITSVGTLTSLTVGGTTNLGAVGNVVITGGIAGQVLSTNGSGNLSWQAPGPFLVPISTTTNLSNSAASINTTNKVAGLMVFNTVNKLFYVTEGTTATSPWYPSNGASAITPAP